MLVSNVNSSPDNINPSRAMILIKLYPSALRKIPLNNNARRS